jgi:hypothetical protein
MPDALGKSATITRLGAAQDFHTFQQIEALHRIQLVSGALAHMPPGFLAIFSLSHDPDRLRRLRCRNARPRGRLCRRNIARVGPARIVRSRRTALDEWLFRTAAGCPTPTFPYPFSRPTSRFEWPRTHGRASVTQHRRRSGRAPFRRGKWCIQPAVRLVPLMWRRGFRHHRSEDPDCRAVFLPAPRRDGSRRDESGWAQLVFAGFASRRSRRWPRRGPTRPAIVSAPNGRSREDRDVHALGGNFSRHQSLGAER